jgi:transposase
VVAYAGLDSQPGASGTSVRKPARSSRMGNPRVRRLLFMGALGGVRGKHGLRGLDARLMGRGQAKLVALLAAARKILVGAWAV